MNSGIQASLCPTQLIPSRGYQGKCVPKQWTSIPSRECQGRYWSSE